jgi:hypothetical protein
MTTDAMRHLVLALVLIAGCGDDDGTPATDSGPVDSGPLPDGAIPDGGPVVDGFAFRTDDPSAYARVDRVGMPAVSSALITSKDEYNDGDPAGDLMPPTVPWRWGTEIIANLSALHDALEEDLSTAGLAGCADYAAVPADATACVLQMVGARSVGELVVPDTLSIDTAAPAGFPNGRVPADPAMDRTLSILLLDLGSASGCGGPCTPGTLEALPLNPSVNDLVFEAEFPYLVGPHVP